MTSESDYEQMEKLIEQNLSVEMLEGRGTFFGQCQLLNSQLETVESTIGCVKEMNISGMDDMLYVGSGVIFRK